MTPFQLKPRLSSFTKQLLFSSAVLSSSSQLYAQSDSASVMVLDASGSMWKQIENNQSRIEIARRVIESFLTKRNQSKPLGVIAYGHNRRGDCADIEVIAPVAQHSANALSKQINQISPKGKTPLTAALAMAVEQIPRTAEEADIILVTDGLETCAKDPCQLARDIAAQGIEIRAHVVGFGLTKKEADSLACITQATGGQLLTPQTGEQLINALESVEKIAPKAAPLVNFKIIIKTVPGTARPEWVNLRAKNMQSGDVKNFGKRQNADQVLSYLPVVLPPGEWLLIAEGEQGRGELKVRVANQAEYQIPYQAAKGEFSMDNLGPYPLGQSNTFLLRVEKPIQAGKTLTAALIPKGAKDWGEVVASSYLFAEDNTMRQLSFEAPQEPGRYQIIITENYLSGIVASFDVEYAAQPVNRIEMASRVKPGVDMPFKLYGNWYPNNPLALHRQGQEVSSIWLGETITEQGTVLKAPSELGQYQVVYTYNDSQGERHSQTLAQFEVTEQLDSKTDQVVEEAKPAPQSETSSSPQQGEYSAADIEQQAAEDQSSAQDTGYMQGNWALQMLNQDRTLFRTQIIHDPARGEGVGDILVIDQALLGQATAEDKLQLSITEEKGITGSFSTSKGVFTLVLNDDPPIKNANTTQRFGQLKGPDNLQLEVLLAELGDYQPSAKERQIASGKPVVAQVSQAYPEQRFDTSDLSSLVFQCSQPSCVYNDPVSGLQGIPLKQNWAIEEPFFYRTAGGATAEVPSIKFVNVKNGLWFVINPRQLGSDLAECYRFGKQGRLSSEEQMCVIRTQATGEEVTEMANFVEAVEFWRQGSYSQQSAAKVQKPLKKLQLAEKKVVCDMLVTSEVAGVLGWSVNNIRVVPYDEIEKYQMSMCNFDNGDQEVTIRLQWEEPKDIESKRLASRFIHLESQPVAGYSYSPITAADADQTVMGQRMIAKQKSTSIRKRVGYVMEAEVLFMTAPDAQLDFHGLSQQLLNLLP